MWLDREQSLIDRIFMSPKIPFLLHTCATCSELPSNISTRETFHQDACRPMCTVRISSCFFLSIFLSFSHFFRVLSVGFSGSLHVSLYVYFRVSLFLLVILFLLTFLSSISRNFSIYICIIYIHNLHIDLSLSLTLRISPYL